MIEAAAGGAMLALAVFALIFGFAITRIEPARQQCSSSSAGYCWAPIGVFALAFVVGAQTRFDSLGAFAHYLAIVSLALIVITLLVYPLAISGGRIRLAVFARVMIAAGNMAVAIYLAGLHGIDLSFWQIAAGAVVAAIVSVAAVAIASALTCLAMMAVSGGRS